MFTKLRVVLITGAVALAGIVGVAAAQGKGGAGPGRAERKAKMLEKFDANKDGTLDAAEKKAMFDERAAKRFAKLDTNKDGALSLEEFKAGKQGMGRMGRGGKFRGGKFGGGGRGGGPSQP